ncbi:unnamed protein product [Clonostachys rosea]|uniref:Uncharacterized protein n=1 Tax=Bionectria ochroleuca TaxID=29856 RepID=A0ABY6U6P2_BIOOC|nr:unnamed protein product [Clonostachys rosea]
MQAGWDCLKEVAFVVHEALDSWLIDERGAEVLNRVLSFVDDAPTWGQSTSVHAAARRGHGIREALEKEPWALNEADCVGDYPIHVAGMFGNKDALEDLIHANASFKLKNFLGQTALMYAVNFGHIDCVRLLLGQTGITVDQRDNSERTALHYAAMECNPEIVAALLAAGANASARDHGGQSPLHFLGKNCTNHERIEQSLRLFLASAKVILLSRVAPFWCLLEAGASMQLLDKLGQNVLDMAACSNLDTLQYLLSLEPKIFRGINSNQQSAYFWTPWTSFQRTLTPSDLYYREESSHEASQAAFSQLLQITHDENLQWEIRILECTLTHMRQGCMEQARSQLDLVIGQRQKWKDEEFVCYYRGISQQIQAGDFEGVIAALEEDIEDLHRHIGSSPWLRNPGSGDIISDEEEVDQTDDNEDGDSPYETAGRGDEVESKTA